MPILQDERFQEVAQLLAVTRALDLRRSVKWVQAYPGGPFEKEFRIGGYARKWKRAFLDTGLDFLDFGQQADGLLFGRNISSLKILILEGKVSRAEAQAYLRQKFGGTLEFADGIFDMVTTSEAEAVAIDVEQPTSAQDEFQSLSDRSIEVKRALSASGGGDQYESRSLILDEFPEAYDRRDVQQTVEFLARQIQLQMNELRSGRINFRVNSLDGRALAPGSVPFSKTFFPDFYDKLNAWPGPDDAIQMTFSPDTTVDRWHDAGELAFMTAAGGTGATHQVKGPGRVQKVTSSRFRSRTQRPSPGPTRYRIIEPGMRFGLVSICRIFDDSGTLRAHNGKEAIWELTYGAVIRGLPNFLSRSPQFIRVAWVGDVPCGLVSEVHDPGNGVPGLFHSKPNRDFLVTPPRMLEPYSLLVGAANYTPEQEILDRFTGFNVMLITGDTPMQTYAQLNGRPNTYIQISGNPHGPMATTHETRMQGVFVGGGSIVSGEGQDIPWRAPAPPCVLESNDNNFNFDNYVREVSGGIPDGDLSRRVVQGVPFTLEDCERLRPTTGEDGQFSVYVEVKMRRKVAGGPHTLNPSIEYWQDNHDVGMRVGAWWTQGARVVQQGHRQSAVDIVVW